jgi:hypothetical protein
VTKSKTIAAAFAALTLAIAATSGEAPAQGRPHAAANSNSAYTVDHGYDECRFVERIDRKGNVLTIKICDVVPY